MTSNTGTGRRGHSGGDPRGEPRGAEVDRSPSVMQSSGGLRERFVTLKYFFGNDWAAHCSQKFEKQISRIDFKFHETILIEQNSFEFGTKTMKYSFCQG